jgi:alkylated DNA nucleotide flippase Atl1
MQPIFNHREIVGYASTAAQAAKIVKKTYQHIAPGFRVIAKQRDTSIVDLPAGWVFSIVK